jgi:DNA-binding response OmpR family regulator
LNATITTLHPRVKPSLLVADRDPVARCLVCDRLREEGYRVLEAHSFDAATAILTTLPVHLLLLDASLEPAEGRPSLLECAARLRPPPAVVVTGTRETLSRLRDFADPTLIEKPCALPDLLAIIRNRLGPTAQR